jgi:diadenosine tetraphosphate (Ap4A) HIT family hydrolase/predicted house-cleaning noncanonical NTP pyrophosphatase (MazG superfamily)
MKIDIGSMALKRFRVEKLIRDHLPDIMRNKGILVHERVMEQDEFIAKLHDKLQEEAKEIKHAKDKAELADELADMLEVIYALSMATGISLEQIEKARLAKLEAKGGFDRKIYNSSVEIEEANPSIEYYLKKPQQYPLIETATYQPNCLFCQFSRREKEVKLLETFSHCYAIKDEYPVSKGHVLIIPKEHTENWFTSREEIRLDMVKALHLLKARLDLEYKPQGYNIGANCGEAAGQSVMHLHLHLIPRYQGDMENPKGGVRGVIPSKQKY